MALAWLRLCLGRMLWHSGLCLDTSIHAKATERSQKSRHGVSHTMTLYLGNPMGAFGGLSFCEGSPLYDNLSRHPEQTSAIGSLQRQMAARDAILSQPTTALCCCLLLLLLLLPSRCDKGREPLTMILRFPISLRFYDLLQR